MTESVWWNVLAGFLIGFILSTLWEWLYFRRRRLRIQNRRIAELEATVRSFTLADNGASKATAPGPTTGYQGPGVFLENEGAPMADSGTALYTPAVYQAMVDEQQPTVVERTSSQYVERTASATYQPAAKPIEAQPEQAQQQAFVERTGSQYVERTASAAHQPAADPVEAQQPTVVERTSSQYVERTASAAYQPAANLAEAQPEQAQQPAIVERTSSQYVERTASAAYQPAANPVEAQPEQAQAPDAQSQLPAGPPPGTQRDIDVADKAPLAGAVLVSALVAERASVYAAEQPAEAPLDQQQQEAQQEAQPAASTPAEQPAAQPIPPGQPASDQRNGLAPAPQKQPVAPAFQAPRPDDAPQGVEEHASGDGFVAALQHDEQPKEETARQSPMPAIMAAAEPQTAEEEPPVQEPPVQPAPVAPALISFLPAAPKLVHAATNGTHPQAAAPESQALPADGIQPGIQRVSSELDTLLASLQGLIKTTDPLLDGANESPTSSRNESGPAVTGPYAARNLSRGEYAVVRMMQSARQFGRELRSLYWRQ